MSTRRRVLYMAHPVAGDVDANVKRALRWLAWLRRSFPETTFIAPWLASIAAGDVDADPAQREAGLVDAEAVIARIDGVVLVGGRITNGMLREADGARSVFDMTPLGDEPPAVVVGAAFDYWRFEAVP